MKNTFMYLWALLLFSVSLNGQKIEWSEARKFSKKVSYNFSFQIINVRDDAFTLLSKGDKDDNWQIYDYAGNLQKEVKYEPIKVAGYKESQVHIYLKNMDLRLKGFGLAGDYYLVDQLASVNTKEEAVFAYKFDLTNLSFIGKPIMLSKAVAPPKNAEHLYKKEFNVQEKLFSYGLSENQQFITMVASPKPLATLSENQVINVGLFTEGMKEVFAKDIVLNYKTELYQIENSVVSNSGEVFILGKVYNDKPKKDVNYSFHLLRIDTKGEYEGFEIDTKGRNFEKLYMSYNDENKQLKLIADYSDKNDDWKDNFVGYTLEEKSHSLKEVVSPVPSTITYYESDRTKEVKLNKGLLIFDPDDMYIAHETSCLDLSTETSLLVYETMSGAAQRVKFSSKGLITQTIKSNAWRGNFLAVYLNGSGVLERVDEIDRGTFEDLVTKIVLNNKLHIFYVEKTSVFNLALSAKQTELSQLFEIKRFGKTYFAKLNDNQVLVFYMIDRNKYKVGIINFE